MRPPPSDTGIRPFLVGLYCHTAFLQFSTCRSGRRNFRGVNLYHVIHESPAFFQKAWKRAEITKKRDFFREREKKEKIRFRHFYDEREKSKIRR